MVFFRAQESLTDDLQKQLNVSNNPHIPSLTFSSATLPLRPTQELNSTYPPYSGQHRRTRVQDAEISTISSYRRKKTYFVPERPSLRKNTRDTEASWHSDIQFEEVPADYTSLRIVDLPKNGGDTLWASGSFCLLSSPLLLLLVYRSTVVLFSLAPRLLYQALY